MSNSLEQCVTTEYLTKQQADKIAQITSSIFPQGNTWVMREWDLETGTERLTRGLTELGAKKRLKTWRKERVESLLRADGSAKAFAIRIFHKNPSWQGEGVWRWAHNHWFTTWEEAEKTLQKKFADPELPAEIYELKTAELPGHFSVA